MAERSTHPDVHSFYFLSCEISSVGHFASCIQKYTFIKLVIMMETCWHSQKKIRCMRCSFFFGEVNVGGLKQKKLEQLFFSQLWSDQFVDKLFSRY